MMSRFQETGLNYCLTLISLFKENYTADMQQVTKIKQK